MDLLDVNSGNIASNLNVTSTLNWISDKVRYISRIKRLVEGSPLSLVDDKRLNFILDGMEEINDKVYMFGRSTSQISRKLQTLAMLFPAGATYRVLAQIIAQIESCQSAIVENVINIRKKIKITAAKQERIADLKNKDMLNGLTYEEKLELIELESDTEKLAVELSSMLPYLEASIKEVGFLIESYNQVKTNKGIPDNWTEEDFEKAEFEAHVMGAFRNAVRDFLSSGRPNWATCEWWEQLGISPFEGSLEVEKLFSRLEDKMVTTLSYEDYCTWLKEMCIKYKDRYKQACKNIGLDPVLVSKLFTISSESLSSAQLIKSRGEDDGVQISRENKEIG